MKKTLILDLNSLFHVTLNDANRKEKKVISENGTVVTGSYYTTKAIIDIISCYGYFDHVIGCFDTLKSSNTGEDFQTFIDLIVPALGISIWGQSGSRSDDLIASLTNSKKLGLKVVASSNISMLSLLDTVDDDVKVLLYKSKKKQKLWTAKDFLDEYQFYPLFFNIYRAIKGDSDSGIEGIKGFGKKRTLKLMERHAFNFNQIIEDSCFSDKDVYQIGKNYGLLQTDLNIPYPPSVFLEFNPKLHEYVMMCEDMGFDLNNLKMFKKLSQEL